jgi:branched-chain amino acid transport system ATP-binding protein
MSAALRTEGLTKAWGGFVANDGISFALRTGARHALIGPNGAGKTTLVNLLAGTLLPTRGEVYLAEARITQLPQHERVRRGLARTFQVSNLFPGLSVLESVMLAVCERTRAAWTVHRATAACRVELTEALALLDSLGLAAHADTATRELPYGRQRLVEIALALATRPRVLLLDEPAAGIPRGESEAVFRVISALPADVTVLFIEHDMDLVFRFAERITVMAAGRVLMEGSPEEVSRDERVREVYLGEASHG